MIEEPIPGSLFILPCLSEPDRSIIIAVPQAKVTRQEYTQAKAEQPCDLITEAQAIESPVAGFGQIWNPQPKDIHIEVERMLQATAAPAVAEDCPANALNVPGAIAKCTSKAKASTGKAAAAKPKGAKAKAAVK
jgi:hypothetical protein